MTQFATDRLNGHDSIDVDRRTRRALSEALSVVTPDGHPVESPDRSVVMVVSHSGETYHVDADAGVCECPDFEYNLPEGNRETCKHIDRARIALGRQPVDAQVLVEIDVDNTLAANAPGPTVVTSDGGVVAGDEGEVLDEDSNGRADDCEECSALPNDWCCAPCYIAGERQLPNEE
jgi:predicted nucleic acid-binding Zn finger protein